MPSPAEITTSGVPSAFMSATATAEMFGRSTSEVCAKIVCGAKVAGLPNPLPSLWFGSSAAPTLTMGPVATSLPVHTSPPFVTTRSGAPGPRMFPSASATGFTTGEG